jgi:hypothetical protein
MPTLKIKTLFCQVPEDNGADEAYLVVDGQKIWGHQTIDVGQGLPVNKEVKFVNSVDIKLFDKDGPIDKDDYLGTITVTKALKGKGEQKGKFTEDGANYTLFYQVV